MSKIENPDSKSEFSAWVIEQINKLNVKVDTVAYGQTQICNTLELNGLMKSGEPVSVQKQVPQKTPQNPVDAINFDIDKVIWSEPYDSEKGLTWHADAEKNNTNGDFKKLWKDMADVRTFKGLQPGDKFFFGIKTGKYHGQFCWFDQSGNGIYRRQKA